MIASGLDNRAVYSGVLPFYNDSSDLSATRRANNLPCISSSEPFHLLLFIRWLKAKFLCETLFNVRK